VAVALIDCGVGGEEVEVTAAFDIVDPDAGGALDDDVERLVVVRAVLILERNEVRGRGLLHETVRCVAVQN
jgi:hypothetical protein